MQLIDKQDNLSIAVLHFLKNCFQTFLELAPVFCTGNKRSHIKGKDRLLFQPFRHVSADNTLRQSFYDCRFTDTRFTDQHRVVLRLTGKDTDHIADLFITADDRIKLLLSRALHKILSVFI